jgi:NAD(P)-dependent dehydrogenase (short-subunit alcohol dehydrogenase family)
MGRLEGKVAIVTGAATGVGRETAILFAEEGAKVVVADFRAEEAAETVLRAGGAAIFIRTDVSSSDDVRNLIAETERQFGRLDVMVANAGISGRGSGKTLEEVTEEELEEVMAVNFWGACWCLKYSISPMKRTGGGTMTVTTSLAGHHGYPDQPGYVSSKHAITGLVKSIASAEAPLIRANTVAAGAIRTELRKHTAELKGLPADSGEAQIAETRLAKADHFWSDPREIAQAHLFLACDESSFVNGTALVVDGGRTARVAGY